MEDDGFTLVTGKKAGKNRENSKKFQKTPNGHHIRIDGTSADIAEAMTQATIGIEKSHLATWAAQKIQILAPNSSKIQSIFIIGNGHFDAKSEPGAHQLAFFLGLAKKFECHVVFQEPICSSAENQWLREAGIQIREKIDTEIDFPRGISILGMIHGEHEIFNEILEKKWAEPEKIDNLIVIGNDYGDIDWQVSMLSEENPRINEFFGKSRVFSMPGGYEQHGSAFSSTVIMKRCLD